MIKIFANITQKPQAIDLEYIKSCGLTLVAIIAQEYLIH